MKYVSPKYELAIIESIDIISASGGYKVEKSEDGTIGNVIMNAADIFR
jgi:hypothetical protein